MITGIAPNLQEQLHSSALRKWIKYILYIIQQPGHNFSERIQKTQLFERFFKLAVLQFFVQIESPQYFRLMFQGITILNSESSKKNCPIESSENTGRNEVIPVSFIGL